MHCGQKLDNMLLNPYGIDLSSLNSHLDAKLKVSIRRQSLGSNSERIRQISRIVLRAASDFKSVKYSSRDQSHFAISLAIGDMFIEGSTTVLPQVCSTRLGLRA